MEILIAIFKAHHSEESERRTYLLSEAAAPEFNKIHLATERKMTALIKKGLAGYEERKAINGHINKTAVSMFFKFKTTNT